MKILYAVQATGNGHISRARDVYPLLKEYGDVHIFLSGSNAHLNPSMPVEYRSKGLSLFYNSKGGLDYPKILQNCNFLRIYKEANQLPLEKYDIIINDYESITSLACRLKKRNSVHFGHQASYISANVPRPPKRDSIGEFVLKNYARATTTVGLHFWPYDKQIFTPILRPEILQGKASNNGSIVVYLSQYSADFVRKKFAAFPHFQFHIFSKDVRQKFADKHMEFLPIDQQLFTEKLLQCHGIITGAGFETPAEALYLGKKLMVIPIHAQYEQLCNAEALKEWHVPVLQNLDTLDNMVLESWYNSSQNKDYNLLFSNADIVKVVVESALLLGR